MRFILNGTSFTSGDAGNPRVGMVPGIIEVERKPGKEENPTHNEGRQGLHETRDPYRVPILMHHLTESIEASSGVGVASCEATL